MSEDKRITKTKQKLKEALIKILEQKSFDELTVTELCTAANITRITFYKHYSDKQALVDAIYRDLMLQGKEQYFQLQGKNNPENDPIQCYCNILDAIILLYFSNIEFFKHADPASNSYLGYCFYKNIMDIFEEQSFIHRHSLAPKYQTRKIAAFLCYGIGGFMNEGNTSRSTLNQVRKEGLQILKAILESDIVTEKKNS